MAEALLKAGAKAQVANRLGVTPLHLAATNGNAAMLEQLLAAGADANASLPEGETVLMTAARTGNSGRREGARRPRRERQRQGSPQGTDAADVGRRRKPRRGHPGARGRRRRHPRHVDRQVHAAPFCRARRTHRRHAGAARGRRRRERAHVRWHEHVGARALQRALRARRVPPRSGRRSQRRRPGLDGPAPDRLVAAAEPRIQSAGGGADRQPRQSRARQEAGGARRERERAHDQRAARRQPQHDEPHRLDAIPDGRENGRRPADARAARERRRPHAQVDRWHVGHHGGGRRRRLRLQARARERTRSRSRPSSWRTKWAAATSTTPTRTAKPPCTAPSTAAARCR